MTDQNFVTGVALIKMALALFDKSEHPNAPMTACHLQAAVDFAEGRNLLTGEND